MPRKIRELKKELRKSGFAQMPGRGKGSHTMWQHATYRDLIVELSGNDGADAGRYHEVFVDKAVVEARRRDAARSIMKPKYSMIIRWSDEDNCYIAWIPEFGIGIKTHGDSYEEAARMGSEVVELSITNGESGELHMPDPWLHEGADEDLALGQHLFPNGFYYRSYPRVDADGSSVRLLAYKSKKEAIGA